MNLTAKGRYAVTAMLDLAMYKNEKAVPLIEISKRQNISLSYLEQLFAKLRINELVVSLRGPGGGYRLKKTPDEISVSSIIYAVGEPVDIRRCKGDKNCNNNARCITHILWEKLNININDFLSGMSLADLIKDNETEEKR